MIGGKLLSASAAVQPTYIEDVFSTYLYTGNGTSQTITNGIDLAGEGGLVWTKGRSITTNNILVDTERGAGKSLASNSANLEASGTTITAFTGSGFSLGNNGDSNSNAQTFASWSFRKSPRFFDVVTYAGNGTSNRQIQHNLGCEVGCIIVKNYSGPAGLNWAVYHRGNTAAPETEYLRLNSTNATVDQADYWNDTAPTNSVFTVGSQSEVNAIGYTYVAYLFAHDPLGPSGDGSDGLIACGEVGTFDVTVNLGWEPQWILYKRANGLSDWYIFDTMRGLTYVFNGVNYLLANTSAAETQAGTITPVTNGFVSNLTGSYIYIAIRRGPMREPTVGTQVFAVDRGDGTTTNPQFVSGFAVDLGLWRAIGAGNNWETASRITGQYYLRTNTTASQLGPDADIDWDFMTGFYGPVRNTDFYSWMFRRAPGFFDVVAYRGTGSTGTKNHNLGVVPEMMIFKNRNDTDPWIVYHQATGNTGYTPLNMTSGFLPASLAFNNTSPTATVFTVGSTLNFSSSFNYIAYLFASLPGISKVGSYTGNGSSQTINCAFTTGARFVLIKRTDTTGDWYVWDTARGIVSGNDPHLSLNTTAAEVTTDDTIDPDNSGFIVNQVAATNINVNAATYIYLAIA